jgi:CRISPR-associated protein Csd1
MILSETTVKKSASDAQPLLGGQFLRSIISATPYPTTLFNAMLTRVRAGEDVSRTKVAVIKAVLIRNYNESEVTTVSLNPQSNDQAYVLGRLFSVLEQLQKKASGGDLNTTIRDRYFAGACANPAASFPTLLKLSMHHCAKLDDARFYEQCKTKLLGKLDEATPFPSTLNLEGQGRFILGYYHQTQWFYSKTEEKGEF